ncbi:MAG: O-antigen ligase family protein, partial [Opitutae bacterium]|nr:O-antigen ligase family protein [Opitutae bacterium]
MADPRTSPPPPTARSSAAEWMLTGLLAGNLAWTTLCLGGYLAQTMAVTVALTGLTLAVHLLHRARGIERAPLHPAGWLVLPFLAYGAANALWITPVPWLGWLDWLGWAQLGAVFWVALNGVRSPGPRAALLGTVFALAAVSAALGVYQCFGHTEWLMLGRRQAEQFFGRASGSFGIPNSLAALLLLVLPAASALALRPGIGAARRLAWSALAAWYAFGLYLTISRGGWLACALALAAAPLLMGRLPKARRVGLALGALAVGVALVAGLYFAAPRVRARLDAAVQDAGERTRPIMWRGAWQIFAEHPAWGGGAGGFNVLFEKHRPERYQDEPQWAHNDYVNTLADYGAVGFALFFGACGFIVWRCRRGARMVSGANGEAQGRGADLPHSASCRAGSPNPAAPNPTAEERSTAAPL